MASCLRSLLPLLAAVVAAGMLSISSPALAAGSGEAGSAMAAAPDVRHRTAQRLRLAASRDRYVRPVRNDAECSGAWCRRHFVLMIGIAY